MLTVNLCVYSREGGIERYWRRLLDVLGESCTGGEISSLDVIILHDDKEVRQKSFGRTHVEGAGGNRLKGVARFAASLIAKRPDTVIYAHVNLASLLCLGRILAPRARHMLLVYGIEAWRKPTPLRRALVKCGTTTIVSISATTANRMRESWRLPMKPFCLLPCAVDPAKRVRGERQSGGQNNRLLTVGRLERSEASKNVGEVIGALPEILAAFPTVRYDIVGDGDALVDLKELATDLGVTEHVHFAGAISDELRDQYYSNADLFVFPSTTEGFGIVTLEAWSYELAVIGGNAGATMEIVRDGIDGLCVGPHPKELARAVLRLLRDSSLRGQIATAGRHRVTSQFSHSVFSSNVRRIFLTG